MIITAAAFACLAIIVVASLWFCASIANDERSPLRELRVQRLALAQKLDELSIFPHTRRREIEHTAAKLDRLDARIARIESDGGEELR